MTIHGNHSRVRQSRAGLACAIGFILLATACGGDDDEGADAPTTTVAEAPTATVAEETTASTGSSDGPRVVQLHPDAITAGGWYRDGTVAFEAFAKAVDASEVSVLERITYDEAPQTLRRLASEGWDVIIPHSSGYEAAVLEVAPEFPDTFFIIYSDLSTTNDLPNVAGWAVNWNEVGYMAAVIGCLASETGQVGMVNSQPIPAMSRWAGGAQEILTSEILDKECDFNIVWTGDFTDAALARQAAQSMIDEGADVLFDAADASGVGALEAAIQNDVLYVGGVVDQCEQAPDQIITSVTMNFDIAYEQMAELYNSDSLEPSIYPLNIANGGIEVLDPYCNDPGGVKEGVDKVIEMLTSGELVADVTAELQP